MKKKVDECPVKFYHIIPKNLKECPFIVTISVGQHNHPAPPPRKTPYNIRSQIQKIIDNENILDLTARKFLTGKILKITKELKELETNFFIYKY